MKETPHVPFVPHHSKDRPKDLVFVGNTTTGRSFYVCIGSDCIYMTLMDDGCPHWRRWSRSERLTIENPVDGLYELTTPEELCMAHKAKALLNKEIDNV